MSSRARDLALVTLLVVCFATIDAATPALADPGDVHCATYLVPSSIDAAGVIVASQVDLGCFPTYAQALSASTHPNLYASGQLSAADAVTIGTEWDGTGFAGSSRSFSAAETCSPGVIWSVSYVGDTWNDRFQSGKGFGGCDTNKKFADSNFGGAVLTCSPNCSDYGSLANEVSSLRWRP
jgi:hypothetical protein